MSTQRDGLRDGAMIALQAAEAAGEATARVASNSALQVGAMLAVSVARAVRGIIEAHGQTGAVEAVKRLEELRANGPQGITDSQLGDDDAEIRAEIRRLYEYG